jgi:NAD(P)-dependent dehydrogenase (short-subunit alcohol dehydrogenase family)
LPGRPKSVLITGASSGIGRASALYLAGKGYRVAATSRSLGRLDGLRREVQGPGTIHCVELDVNSDRSVSRATASVIEAYGRIDALVNNAGYGLWGPVQSFTMEELESQFQTNFFGAFRMIKAVLPSMTDAGGGTIINVSSVEGRLATPFSGGYAASKFALEGLSEAMRYELWPQGIRVAVVEPGLFATDFHDSQVESADAESPALPYGPVIARYRERRGKYDRFAKDPVRVARVIHKIIRSRRPRFRYPVGAEATLGVRAAQLMPERLYQALLGRAMG